MKRVVLIVDDQPAFHIRPKGKLRRSAELREKWEIISAYTEQEARALFLEHSERIAFVFMDACLTGHTPNTLDLIKWVRTQYDGPMIAMSSVFNTALIKAGCDQAINKNDIGEEVLKRLE